MRMTDDIRRARRSHALVHGWLILYISIGIGKGFPIAARGAVGQNSLRNPGTDVRQNMANCDGICPLRLRRKGAEGRRRKVKNY